MTHIHKFIQDKTRAHGRAGRCFTICECGETGQASLLTGRRFTTGPQNAAERKEITALRTYKRQRELLAAHEMTPQKFFDKAYSEFINSVYTESV